MHLWTFLQDCSPCVALHTLTCSVEQHLNFSGKYSFSYYMQIHHEAAIGFFQIYLSWAMPCQLHFLKLSSSSPHCVAILRLAPFPSKGLQVVTHNVHGKVVTYNVHQLPMCPAQIHFYLKTCFFKQVPNLPLKKLQCVRNAVLSTVILLRISFSRHADYSTFLK